MRPKYHIWDCGKLTPAYTRRPRDPRAVRIGSRTIREVRLGIRWFIPITAADYSAAEYEGKCIPAPVDDTAVVAFHGTADDAAKDCQKRNAKPADQKGA